MFDGKYLEWNQKRIKSIIDFYGHKFIYMKKLLDLGCGQADISGAMYRLGADVTAVDARQEHLKIASKKFQGLKTVKADLDREWPFKGKKFDIIIDLGLLCHLRDYEQHLVDVCHSTSHLVLETAVCDSDDPNKCISVDESKGIYDNSINGVGCRPSAAAIERVLTNCGMTFKRIDSGELNSGNFTYDWHSKNNGDTSINKRRMWFCVKTGAGSYQFTPSLGKTHHMASAHNFQPTHKHVPIAKPPLEIVKETTPSNGPLLSYTNNDIPGIEEIKTTSKKFSISPTNFLKRYPNLKVFYVPLGDQKGMVDAFNNLGVQLKVFDFWTAWNNSRKNNHQVNQQFLTMVDEFKPNLIHMQLQITDIITPDTINKARSLSPGVIISNWSGDIRNHVINEMKIMSNTVDYTLISSTGQLNMYQQAGCRNVKYWQIGYDPKVHHPKYNCNFEYDVSFIGNNYGTQFPDGPTRLLSVNKCLQTFGRRFGIFGTGWPGIFKPCDPSLANDIYNKSICALSISNFNNVSHYFSDRLLYCLSSGRPTISWYFPGCESYFVEGEEIFYAKSPQDIIDIVNYCKENPEKANTVGEKGAQKVLAEHTYTSRAHELLNIIGLAGK